MKTFAYAVGQMVPIARTIICKIFMELKTKLFKSRITLRNVMITFANTILAEGFSKASHRVFMSSLFGIFGK